MLAAPVARFPVTVPLTSLRRYQFSAKIQRRQRHRPRNDRSHDELDEMGGVGFAVLTALKSDPPRKDAALETLPHHKADSQRPSNDGLMMGEEKVVVLKDKRGSEGSFTGLDVLMALQNAAAQKESKARKRNHKGKGSTRKGGEDSTDYSDVRPISIKSDWAARLDEMERLLDDLKREEVV